MNISLLVVGDVEGNFKKLFGRVSEIVRKNSNFEYLLVVGSFFGPDNNEWDAVLSGSIKVPITTYILGPIKEEHLKYFPASNELTPNITCLGKHGILNCSSGLKIAYISGLEKKESDKISFSKTNVLELESNATYCPIDILITSVWPQGISKFSKIPENGKEPNSSSRSIAYLAQQLKPKYHFSSSSDIYYESVPYRNYKVFEQATHSTRFISMASMKNTKKLKWIYAFKITPFASQEKKEVSDPLIITTECPYDYDNTKCHEDQFFYDVTSSGENSKRQKSSNDEPSMAGKKMKTEVSREECWFCLSNPDVEQHLVLSVGNYNYLSLAKGGIVPYHLLIIPIKHIPSSIDLPNKVEKEIEQYKQALRNYFSSQSQDVVFFERSLASPHLQIQVVPIPKSKSQNIKSSIFETADEHNLEFVELPELSLLKQIIEDKKNYFYIEIWRQKQSIEKIIHIINKKFPLQFGRLVLANEAVLNEPDRVDWKSCKLPSSEEKNIVVNFRKGFKSYDFTL